MESYKGFKKVAEDSRTATMAHPSGHKIVIAKSGLTGKLKKALKALPLHQAEGSNTPVGDDTTTEQMDPEQYQQHTQDYPPGSTGSSFSPPERHLNPALKNMSDKFMDVLASGGPVAYLQKEFAKKASDVIYPQDELQSSAPQGQQQSDQMPQGQPQAPQQPQEDPAMVGLQTGDDAFTSGLKSQIAGVHNEANAIGNEGQAKAGVLRQEESSAQSQVDDYQQDYQALSNERENFIRDITAGHIDSNKLWNDKSVPQKISTTIGLILGGIGGGISGGPNQALNFYNNQINRNIEAQKANLDSNQNLLRANLEQYHNLHDATAMTRIMYNDIFAAKLAETAAKASNPIAQARAQQVLGQLNQSTAQEQGTVATRRAFAKQMSANSPGGMMQMPDPIDPNLQSSFRMNGVKYYAANPKEAQEASTQSQAIENLEQTTRNINEFNKTHGVTGLGVGLPTQLQGHADALNATAKAAIAHLEANGAGIARLADTFKSAMPVAGSAAQAKQKGKSQGIDEIIRAAKKTILDSHSLQGGAVIPQLSSKR